MIATTFFASLAYALMRAGGQGMPFSANFAAVAFFAATVIQF